MLTLKVKPSTVTPRIGLACFGIGGILSDSLVSGSDWINKYHRRDLDR